MSITTEAKAMKLTTAKRAARLAYKLWQALSKEDRQHPLFAVADELWRATGKERDRLEQLACERADKGVILYEVFVPVYKGSAIRHVTRTPSRVISQTFWLQYRTRQPEPPTSPPNIECHPYTDPWVAFRKLNQPEARA